MNIGIIGTGTVGSGVLEVLSQNKKNFAENNINIQVSKIYVRSLEKAKNLKINSNTEITTDISDILEDPNMDCVVELIGGITTAWDIVRTALENGKNVITANKALIAKFMPEIEALLEKNPKLKFGFEASVGGGIPIIHALQRDFPNDKITKVAGILNGTTNFMLSKMMLEGADYSEVLKEAQDLGFAEANPSADVEGFDVRAKIAILSRLAFGIKMDEERIPTVGITQISQDDFQYAKLLKSSIKLLAVAQKNSEEKLSVYVTPCVISFKNPISQINGATNVVEINSEFLGQSFLVGQGAGQLPTANSVVSDLVEMEKSQIPKMFPVEQKLEISEDFESKFFVRFSISDELGIIRKVAEACEKNGISIDSVLQLPIKNSQNLPFVLTTNTTKKSQIEAMTQMIEKENFCLETPFFMPFFD